MSRTLVMGIGNTLLTDEGVGVHTVAYLRAHYPDLPDVDYMDAGTLSFTLAGEIAEADQWVVVDAAQLGVAAGEVCCFVGAEMDRYLGAAKRSVHEVGLIDLMDIARLTDSLPKRRALVGIQPLAMDWGDAPTEPVAHAIPRAADLVLDLLARWQDETVSAAGL